MQEPGLTAQQIKAARGALGWSVQDLADRTGVGTATISRYELANAVPRANLVRFGQRLKPPVSNSSARPMIDLASVLASRRPPMSLVQAFRNRRAFPCRSRAVLEHACGMPSLRE
ncbi:helix-turn-helix transcriptional regulator [Erythrobacter sp. SCSIO 43205]|uniref:helix-turn-helix domain-containing protein n=1 Tax=Erythrobacter sp. SCSIO 43205 TaxID=2779361 RepID=UPI001CA92E59